MRLCSVIIIGLVDWFSLELVQELIVLCMTLWVVLMTLVRLAGVRLLTILRSTQLIELSLCILGRMLERRVRLTTGSGWWCVWTGLIVTLGWMMKLRILS